VRVTVEGEKANVIEIQLPLASTGLTDLTDTHISLFVFEKANFFKNIVSYYLLIG